MMSQNFTHRAFKINWWARFGTGPRKPAGCLCLFFLYEPTGDVSIKKSTAVSNCFLQLNLWHMRECILKFLVHCVHLMGWVSMVSAENLRARTEEQYLCILSVRGEEDRTMRIFVRRAEKRLFASLWGPLNQSRTMLRKVKHTTHCSSSALWSTSKRFVLDSCWCLECSLAGGLSKITSVKHVARLKYNYCRSSVRLRLLAFLRIDIWLLFDVFTMFA